MDRREEPPFNTQQDAGRSLPVLAILRRDCSAA